MLMLPLQTTAGLQPFTLDAATWIMFVAILGAFGTGIWQLSIWGALRKVEKELQPQIDELEKKRVTAVRDLHEKREKLVRDVEDRFDTMREQTLSLHHGVELDNARLHEQIDGLRSFSATLLTKIDDVERRFESRQDKTEKVLTDQIKVIADRMVEDQKNWRHAISELKNEIRALRPPPGGTQ